MTAPSHTALAIPTGYKMPEGFRTCYMFSSGSFALFQRDVKLVGYDGGNPINTTTQFNQTRETTAFKKLIKLSDGSIVAAFDPDAIPSIRAAINVNQSITAWYPSGDYMDFWGALTKFEPQSFKEGEFPLADCTIVASNQDNGSPPVESPEVYTSAAGT